MDEEGQKYKIDETKTKPKKEGKAGGLTKERGALRDKREVGRNEDRR